MTEDHIGEADLDQRVSNSSRRCNTVEKIGEEGFQGRLIQAEGAIFDNIELDNTKVHTREIHPYDASGTCFQERQEEACTTIKIMQGEKDAVHDDYDNEAGIMGGFLEDSDDDLLNDGEHCGEWMRGYAIENNSKVWEFYLPTLPLKSLI